MNDMDPAAHPDDMAGQGPSAGTLLRQAREAAGMHIAALAVSLKVPVKKMEALEQDRFDELPDAVFVRALASSVCRILKIDPAEVLARLPQTGTPRLSSPGPVINTPFRPAGQAQGPSAFSSFTKPAALLGILLVLGALVLILLPTIRNDWIPGAAQAVGSVRDAATPAPGPASLPDTASVSGAAGGESAPVAAVEPMPPASAPETPVAGPVTPGAALASPSARPAAVAVAPGASTGAAATPVRSGASAAATAAPADGLVVFRAKAQSWVQVTDARGTVALRKMLDAGEVANVSGVPPLTVVVGRADSTEVQVRGKVMDLALLTRDNVARFEVK